VPQPHGVGAAGALRRVAVDVVPGAVLQATAKMYMIEWSSVSRLAFGSIFCGSLAPVPIT
jgi:uncharacterized SAM-dependent methyltransferase